MLLLLRYRALTAYACLLCWPRSSNGAYVYESVNRKAYGSYGHPVFLYLYKVPQTNELVWVIGITEHDKPEEVNDPRYRASKDNQYAFIDSSPPAKGACALNGPATSACKWRECHGISCYAYPKSTGSARTQRNTSPLTTFV